VAAHLRIYSTLRTQPNRLGEALIKHKAAYRIYEHHIIAISNEIDAKMVIDFFNSNILDDYHGAKAHLLQAGQHLASGKFSESIRESIHSVESVCRKISNENTFKDAPWIHARSATRLIDWVKTS
jgi:hypothetical protein